MRTTLFDFRVKKEICCRVELQREQERKKNTK